MITTFLPSDLDIQLDLRNTQQIPPWAGSGPRAMVGVDLDRRRPSRGAAEAQAGSQSFGEAMTAAIDDVARAVTVGSLAGTIAGAAIGGVLGGAGPAFTVVLLPEAVATAVGGAMIGAPIGALAGTMAVGGGALIGAFMKAATRAW